MGWIKDKGGSKKFQLGGQVPIVPRAPGVMPQSSMYKEGGEVYEEDYPGKYKRKKEKRSSKYSAKELVALSKKHNKTVEEIKEIIDAGPKYGKKQRPPKIKYRRPHG